MLIGELDHFVEGNHRAAVDQFGLDAIAQFKHDLDQAVDVVDGLALLKYWEIEPGKKLPLLEVFLLHGDEQRVIVQIASNLIATTGPDVDGIDRRIGEVHPGEMREHIHLREGWR